MADKRLATANLLRDLLQGALDDKYFTYHLTALEKLSLFKKLNGLDEIIQLYVDNHASDDALSPTPSVGVGTTIAIPAGEGGVTVGGVEGIGAVAIGWEVAIPAVVAYFSIKEQRRQVADWKGRYMEMTLDAAVNAVGEAVTDITERVLQTGDALAIAAIGDMTDDAIEAEIGRLIRNLRKVEGALMSLARLGKLLEELLRRFPGVCEKEKKDWENALETAKNLAKRGFTLSQQEAVKAAFSFARHFAQLLLDCLLANMAGGPKPAAPAQKGP